MPGAGKTLIGRKLGSLLRRTFLDLDNFIELRSGISISTWFAERGEEAFRNYEHECLEAIIHDADRPTILAAGGGTPCFNQAIELMLASGQVIYLACDESDLAEKISRSNRRPMFKDLDTMEQIETKVHHLLLLRFPFYSRAHFTVHCTGKSIENILKDIIICLGVQL
jgi:shikimate kinase